MATEPRANQKAEYAKKLDAAIDGWVSIYEHRPITCLSSCTLLMLLIAAAAAGFGLMNIEQQDGAWDILDGEATQWFRAFDKARDQASGRRLQSQGLSRRLTLLEDDSDPTFQVFYKTNVDGTGNVFTPTHLQSICRVEHEGGLKACSDEAGVADYCINYRSPVNLFYGTPLTVPPNDRSLSGFDWECGMLTQEHVDSVIAAMRISISSEGPESVYSMYVHPDFNATGASAYTRSEVNLLGDEGEDAVDDVLDSLGLSYGFLRSAYQGDDDRFVESGSVRVRVFWTEFDEFQAMAGQDFIFSFASMVFVFLVMWSYTKSCFLATSGMTMIVLSLPVGAFFYRGLFRVDYFEFLHILVIYLVLGIGADDIFVLVDTFRHQLAHAGEGKAEQSFHQVLRKTLTTTASAISSTSLTTMLAFLATSGSKAMPMRTCGWYAAICIFFCFLATITFMPAAMVIHYQRFSRKRCCCPAPNAKDLTGDVSKGAEGVRKSFIERGMEKYYIPGMTWQVGPIRPIALLVFLVMLGVAGQGVYFTAQLTPPRTEEVWFPDNHMALDLTAFFNDNYYSPSYERNAVITVYWGIKELDVSVVDIYKPDENVGDIVYDSNFDLTTTEAQESLLATCESLRKIQCDLEGCNNAGYSTLMLQAPEQSYQCFLEDFRAYMGGTLPTGNTFLEELKSFRMTAGHSSNASSAILEVNYWEDIGFINGELKYVAIRIRSTMAKDTPFGAGVDVRDLMRDWADGRRSDSPRSMQSLKFHANGIFASYDLGEELLRGFFQGIAIALPLAFVVLLFSTMNIIVACYATLSVGFIVVSVLGFCKSAMDWDLGVGEAIAGVIVIGYSVDYVLHLAHTYCDADTYGLRTRADRAAFAIQNIGSTVFAGAITTAGAGAPMFACFFFFFVKMAILICVTIMYSFLFSLGFFMSLLWLAGPEKKCGDIRCCQSCEPEVEKTVVHDEGKIGM